MQVNAAVYMLRCSDGSYYVGSTKDGNLDHRLAQHNAGFGGKYTKARRPVVLVWGEHFARYDDTVATERKLKGWSRAKKEALVRGYWDAIVRLAASRGKCRED